MRRLPVLLLVLLVSLPWACEGEPEEVDTGPRTADTAMRAVDTAPPETAAAGSEAPAGSFPPGSFATTVSVQEADGDTLVAGSWELVLAEDGSYRVLRQGELVVFGSYTLRGERITFVDEGGPGACDEPVATYRWSMPEDELGLSVIEDDCQGRTLVFTAHPLRRR